SEQKTIGIARCSRGHRAYLFPDDDKDGARIRMQDQQLTPFKPADVRRALGDDAAGPTQKTEITACCVLFDLGSEEYEAYAVAERGGGREVTVRGFPVFLLPPNAPLSAPLRDCLPGDLLDGMAGSAFCY